MAVSLAFMAAGLMVGYLLFDVIKEPGKTLNAVLMESITTGWGRAGRIFVLFALVSEAVLLFVAAQTGFLDGPRVLANMSIDRWLPRQFGLLSERLVIKNGIFLMGGAALILMIVSGGSVQFLLVLYAINVFITFFLSQLGMVLHWWKERRGGGHWKRRIAVEGHRAPSDRVHPHVADRAEVQRRRLDHAPRDRLPGGRGVHDKEVLCPHGTPPCTAGHLMTAVTEIEDAPAAAERVLGGAPDVAEGGGAVPAAAKPRRQHRGVRYDPKGKTAVLLVSGFNGTGLHTLFNVRKIFGDTFRNWFFIQAGIVDVDRFRGADAMDKLTANVEKGLDRYVTLPEVGGILRAGLRGAGHGHLRRDLRACGEASTGSIPAPCSSAGRSSSPRTRSSPASCSTTPPLPCRDACTSSAFPSSSCPSGSSSPRSARPPHPSSLALSRCVH